MNETEKKAARAARALIVVQNLPVPLDRRVWLECKALRQAGYEVSVICVKGADDSAYEELDGVHIYRYRQPPPTRGALSYLWEFAYCWVRTALLSFRVARRHGFDIFQACNPPDTYWALGAIYKLLGKRFVYDQHDLNPEVFLSRFGVPCGLVAKAQYRSLCWLERMTYRFADEVISPNESYRQVALDRGGRRPDRVTVVRSGPDTSRMRPVLARPELRRGRAHLAVYLGIMGPQDGVDLALRALDVYVHELARDDLHLALLGFGDCFDDLKSLATALKLGDFVTFTGRADARLISEYLSTASVGLSPDPLNPLNDVSTMNKTMEYMAYALPVVAFDLKETRVSAADAAIYVEPGDIAAYAKAMAALVDDPDTRADMAIAGRRRASAVLDWEPQRRAYVEVYDRLAGRRTTRAPSGSSSSGLLSSDLLSSGLLSAGTSSSGNSWPDVDRRRTARPLVDQWGNRIVDLRDPIALDRFVRTRSDVTARASNGRGWK